MTSWEEAVRWYRVQPDNAKAVRNNYFDLPVRQAAERYSQSEEFRAVARVLGDGAGRAILDVGAGNGITSYAFARHGWQVTALEPDPSDEVGAGAIRLLSTEAGLPIHVVQDWGEHLPFQDSSFAAVYWRQVLHHAHDLEAMVQEVARVVRQGGQVLFTRDHVAEDEAQLAAFRALHPLHHLYGGENAFPLDRYRRSFARAGLVLRREWGALDSIINYYPGTETSRRLNLRRHASWRTLGRCLAWSDRLRRHCLAVADQPNRTPGRLVSFLLVKPSGC